VKMAGDFLERYGLTLSPSRESLDDNV
jgi:hypothetical protein